MSTNEKTGRVLGFAFLLQFITFFSSGVFLKSAWFAPDDMSATMLNIAANLGLMRANILLDMLTALGVTFLGVILFLTLRQKNEKMALTAWGFYLPYVPFELVIGFWIFVKGIPNGEQNTFTQVATVPSRIFALAKRPAEYHRQVSAWLAQSQ